MEKNTSPIFDNNTIEFVTVAAQVCAYLEQPSAKSRSQFVETTLKLLPLLYLKASMLPICDKMEDSYVEKFVTEADYEAVRGSVAAIMAEKDDYLEVFLEDMAFSDTPIKQNISEGLADIYQPLKDFLGVFQIGFAPTMHEALAECKLLFEDFWGQRLVNVMRALHMVRYNRESGDDEDEHSALFNEHITEDDLYEGLDMGDDEDDEF